MRSRDIFIGLVLIWLLLLFLWNNAAFLTEDLTTQDVAATSVEPNGSYMVTDPETGRTLILPSRDLPAGYRPPPRSGPCDEAAKATIDNWQRSITYAVGALGVVVGAFGLFVLAEASLAHADRAL